MKKLQTVIAILILFAISIIMALILTIIVMFLSLFTPQVICGIFALIIMLIFLSAFPKEIK